MLITIALGTLSLLALVIASAAPIAAAIKIGRKKQTHFLAQLYHGKNPHKALFLLHEAAAEQTQDQIEKLQQEVERMQIKLTRSFKKKITSKQFQANPPIQINIQTS